MTESPALTVVKVAEQLSVSSKTVLHWISTGQLTASNCGRKPGAKKPRWRILPADLASFLQSRQPTPPPQRRCRKRRSQNDVVEFY